MQRKIVRKIVKISPCFHQVENRFSNYKTFQAVVFQKELLQMLNIHVAIPIIWPTIQLNKNGNKRF